MKKIFLLILIWPMLQSKATAQGATAQNVFVKMELVLNDKPVQLKNNFRAFFIADGDTIRSAIKGDSILVSDKVPRGRRVTFLFYYKKHKLPFIDVYVQYYKPEPTWTIHLYTRPFKRKQLHEYFITKRWIQTAHVRYLYALDWHTGLGVSSTHYGYWFKPKEPKHPCRAKRQKVDFKDDGEDRLRFMKCSVKIPGCFAITRSRGSFETYFFTDSDSSEIYITSLLDAEYEDESKRPRPDCPESVFKPSAPVLEGVQPNGKYWKEVRCSCFVVGYRNVPPDKKAAFDRYLASARLAKASCKNSR